MRARERARGEDGDERERERVGGQHGVSRQAAGLAGTLPARSRRWRPPGTRSRLHLCLLAEEDDERRGRWAGLVKLGRLQVSGPGRFLSPLSISIFLFCLFLFYLCHCFFLNSKQCQLSSNNFMLQNGLFQMHIKYIRGIWRYILYIFGYISKFK